MEMVKSFNEQIPERLQKQKIVRPKYTEIVKIQDVTRKCYYSTDRDGNIPDGKYGDVEDEEYIEEEKWKLEDHYDQKEFETREELEDFLSENIKLDKGRVNDVGNVNFHGFESSSIVNRGGCLELFHEKYNIVVYAKPVVENGKKEAMLQMVVPSNGRNISSKNLEMDEFTVENFYGAVKEFIEEVLIE